MGWHPFRARRRRIMLQLGAGLLDFPDDQHYVYELTRRIGMRSGLVYPTLANFEYRGWITSGWETPEPENRPRRRWYQLTELGKRDLGLLIKYADVDIADLARRHRQ